MATLHIIGNGFDLKHNIKSKYIDFKNYAWKHASGTCKYYLGMLEECYPQIDTNKGELELWCNLEYALGKPDIKKFFNISTEDIEMEEGHEVRSQAQMEDASDYTIPSMFKNFHNIFEKWVNQIDINVDSVINLPHFDSCGLFLSFNYTETLENLYNIPRKKINYLHGRRNSSDNLIVGHCNNVDGHSQLSKDPMIYEYQAYDSIAEIVNREQKKITEIITANKNYWASLINIDKIVVYGHSLSEVDRPYFKEIARYVRPEAEWFFSIFYCCCKEKQEAVDKVKNMADYLELDINKCHTFKM